jgi:uncharacterized protein (TIGR02646 family)
MKHVDKGPEPQSFVEWKLGENNPDWNPAYADLQNPEKRVVHTALTNEQGYVCCYCGRRIEVTTSHIEHFRPQHLFAAEALVYCNLLASCVRDSGAKEVKEFPAQCGHAKGGQYDEARVISPLEPDCESRFAYGLNGEILIASSCDERAAWMSDTLNLDNRLMRSLRRQVLAGVFDAEFLSNGVSAEELTRIAEHARSKSADGRLQHLGHVVARFAEQLRGNGDAGQAPSS